MGLRTEQCMSSGRLLTVDQNAGMCVPAQQGIAYLLGNDKPSRYFVPEAAIAVII